MIAEVLVGIGCLVLGLVLLGGHWRPLEDRWANLAKQVGDDDSPRSGCASSRSLNSDGVCYSAMCWCGSAWPTS